MELWPEGCQSCHSSAEDSLAGAQTLSQDQRQSKARQQERLDAAHPGQPAEVWSKVEKWRDIQICGSPKENIQ